MQHVDFGLRQSERVKVLHCAAVKLKPLKVQFLSSKVYQSLELLNGKILDIRLL
jgi:hypothetical protein